MGFGKVETTLGTSAQDHAQAKAGPISCPMEIENAIAEVCMGNSGLRK